MLPAWGALYIGMPREEVVAELGKPSALAKVGERETLRYGKNVVELNRGRLVSVRGFPLAPAPDQVSERPVRPMEMALPGGGDEAAATPAKPPPLASPAAETAAAAEALPPLHAPEAVEAEHIAGGAVGGDPGAGSLLADLEKFEEQTKAAQLPAEDEDKPDWAQVVEAGLRFIFALIVIRVAFWFFDMQALWRGYLGIAFVDTLTHLCLHAAFKAWMGISPPHYFESSVVALVLIPTIRYFAITKDWVGVVKTAVATKTVSAFVAIGIGAVVVMILGHLQAAAAP